MRRALLVLLSLCLAVPVPAQIVNGQGGVYVNGVLQGGTGGGTSLPSGTVVFPGNPTPVCDITGVAINSVNATTTTLGKTAHGCALFQGDRIIIYNASIASNLGDYLYTGTETFQPNTIEISGLLTAPETNMSLRAYRETFDVGPGGNAASMVVLDELGEKAFTLGYRMNMTAGESQGFHIQFGTHYSGTGFGTALETGHCVMDAYRYNYKSARIFCFDAIGSLTTLGNLTAVGATASTANVTATAFVTGAAPTVAVAGGTGATTWAYSYVPIGCDGTAHGTPSATTTILDGYDTLSGSHQNLVTVPAQSGPCWVDVRRETSGGTPATTGVIGRMNVSPVAGIVFADTGYAGDSSAAPTTNTTGYVRSPYARIGASSTSTDAALEVVSSVYPPARVTRTATDTNTINNSMQIVKRTTANMAAGFGGQIEFAIQDDTAGPTGIASISAARASSDTTGYMLFGTSGTDRVRIGSTGGIGIGYVAADPGAFLEVDSSAAVGTFVRLRDASVAHGMTGVLPTDRFAALDEVSDNEGGLLVRGLTEDVAGVTPVLVRGISGNASPTAASVTIRGEKKSGTGSAAIAAGEKVLEIDNFGTNPVTVYGSGALTATGLVTGSGFSAGASAGLTTVVTVRDSGGAGDCTMTFTGGILTATTCTHT